MTTSSPHEHTQGRECVLAEIAAESLRQVEQEGWSPEHDDEHWSGGLPAAAACYGLAGRSNGETANFIKQIWPWDWNWWKPTDRRRNLVKAAALIVAEIERLDRARTLLTPGEQP